MDYYNRYSKFTIDGNNKIVPFIRIPRIGSDLIITFDKSKMRMDMLSYKYYGDANYGWLIMLANPQYGSMEFSIPDMVDLRIPYPLQTALNRYENSIEDYKNKNGF